MKQTRRDFLELVMALGLVSVSTNLKAQAATISTILGSGERGMAVTGPAASRLQARPKAGRYVFRESVWRLQQHS